MRRLLAVIVSIALLTPPLPAAAQESARPGVPFRRGTAATDARGPIGRAVEYEVARIVAGAMQTEEVSSTGRAASATYRWRTRRFRRGDEIVVRVKSGAVVAGRFVRADDQTIMVLIAVPGLTPSAENRLKTLASKDIWDRIENDSHTLPDMTRVTSQGIFDPSGERLASLRTIARADVAAVEGVGRKLGTGAKVAIGVALFFTVVGILFGATCGGGGCV